MAAAKRSRDGGGEPEEPEAFEAAVGRALLDLMGRRPQREVADATSMTESTFSRLVHGEGIGGFGKIEDVLVYLGSTWDELMRRAGSRAVVEKGAAASVPAVVRDEDAERELRRALKIISDYAEDLRGRLDGLLGPTGPGPSRPPTRGR